MRSFLFSVWEILEVVLIAAVTVFLIRAFVVQPFLVSGASMENTFLDGDYVLVDELSYQFKTPERGDIIVFRYPPNPRLFYIKRVVGVAGDKVEVADGDVFINGVKINEPYIRDGTTNSRAKNVIDYNYVFVMGDNRLHSYDSRFFGLVPVDNIIGLVKVRLLPAPRARIFDRPAYVGL